MPKWHYQDIWVAPNADGGSSDWTSSTGKSGAIAEGSRQFSEYLDEQGEDGWEIVTVVMLPVQEQMIADAQAHGPFSKTSGVATSRRLPYRMFLRKQVE